MHLICVLFFVLMRLQKSCLHCKLCTIDACAQLMPRSRKRFMQCCNCRRDDRNLYQVGSRMFNGTAMTRSIVSSMLSNTHIIVPKMQ
eukprot:5657921-Amphidinium_carterae.1